MTYNEALEKIHSLLTFGSRPGLDRVSELLRRLGNPQDRLKFIHVAGTNGKGSTCAVLSSVLAEAGYKTGLFVSPYILDFRERIQINNEMISEEELAEAVERTFPLVERLGAEGIVITEFEYVNALEFLIHAEAGCDIVVLETGMGGLLDCTNVIKPPLCSVITTIGLDHTAILGDTIGEIAAQKCGIFKSGSAAVTSAQEAEAMSVIEAFAREKSIPLLKSSDIELEVVTESLRGSRFKYRGQEALFPLAGDHQLENLRTALAALEYLREKGLISVSDEALLRGVSRAENPARLELMSGEPLVLLDGAHNPNGIAALKKALDRFLGGREMILVTGMLADKDIDGAVELFGNIFNDVYTVPVNNPRAISPQGLAEKYRRHGIGARAFDSVGEALQTALSRAEKENAAVIICGSLYLAAEVRKDFVK